MFSKIWSFKNKIINLARLDTKYEALIKFLDAVDPASRENHVEQSLSKSELT